MTLSAYPMLRPLGLTFSKGKKLVTAANLLARGMHSILIYFNNAKAGKMGDDYGREEVIEELLEEEKFFVRQWFSFSPLAQALLATD